MLFLRPRATETRSLFPEDLSVPSRLRGYVETKSALAAERTMPSMPRYVGALDQGTTSTRFMVFDDTGHEVARRQLEHRQIMPGPGWVEHDPIEIAARMQM